MGCFIVSWLDVGFSWGLLDREPSFRSMTSYWNFVPGQWLSFFENRSYFFRVDQISQYLRTLLNERWK